MTDIGIEAKGFGAACYAYAQTCCMAADEPALRAAIQAYLPFHPPREEGLREALQYVASYAETRREHHAPDEVANAFDDIAKRARRALIPTKPEAGESAEPYRPCLIRNEEAGFTEFVTEDVPAITGHMFAANVEPIVRMSGPRGEIIGYRIYDAALQSKKPE